MRRIAFATILLLLASMLFTALCVSAYSRSQSTEQKPKVQLTLVKLDGLEKALTAHKGKIVVVYLWGGYSVPDQKWLAEKVVGMQERFAKQPIIFMTVCHSPVDRDDPKQLEKQRMRILEVL